MDPLFSCRNNFYIGAYQVGCKGRAAGAAATLLTVSCVQASPPLHGCLPQRAVSEASQLTGLTDQQKIERDVFVYRSYIELGSYEVCS